MRHRFLTIIVTVLSGSLRVFKLTLSLIAGIVLISTTTFVLIYFYFARGLPDIHTLEDYKPPVLSKVMAKDGAVIGEFWTECRVFLPIDKIPKRVIQAFVASEDSRFFEHKGVDMRSIARAFVANLKAGEVTQGGSTITQQITRSLLLTQERTINRKIKEAILATRIERYLNKEQILTLYLNQIFLGNRAYGVAAAARNYFHKTLNELNLAETSLIAGMPSAPTLLSPINHPEEARKRQMHVLSRMVDDKIITEKEMQGALNTKLKIYVAGIDKEFASPENAYFVEHVRRLVKEKYGDEILYHKGLDIYSTVDIDKQRAAYLAVRHGVERLTRRQGWKGPVGHVDPDKISEQATEIENGLQSARRDIAIDWPQGNTLSTKPEIIFDNETAYKAIITGFRDKEVIVKVGKKEGVISYKGYKWARPFAVDRVGDENGNYISDPKKILRVGDIVLVKYENENEFSLYQEPLVQGALFSMDPHTGEIRAMIGGYDFSKSEFNRAIQSARQPGSSFKPFVYAAGLDKGYTFNTMLMDAPVQYVVGKNEVWSPKNYSGYKGPVSFQNAITLSLNIPTVKIVADVGTHYLAAYERKMGITTQIDKYLSMALGANAVSLSEMVPAYTVFLNHGVYRAPVYITKIVDAKGVVLEEVEPPKEEENEEPAEITTKPHKANEVELNVDLFEQNKPWVERDKLNLTDIELKTLYGDEIPKDHVITPQTAYLMVNLLKNVVERGTGTRVRVLQRPAAGKTGTTNDETDTWFIGFVPDLSAGVWVGFDEIMPIGKKETGGRTASPIFIEYMQEAAKEFEVRDFDPPPGFPVARIASLAGGSAIFGSRFNAEEIRTAKSADRAGEFFEEDLESDSGNAMPPENVSSPQPSRGEPDASEF